MYSYAWYTQIDDVVEREVCVCGRKAVDGSAILTMESAGWYVRFDNLLIRLGDQRPDLQKGDMVKISIQKVNA